MTEINQLARAKLAAKHGLRVQVYLCNWVTESGGSFDPTREYRVHPDDEAKLDAIIWESLYHGDKFAWIDFEGDIVGTFGLVGENSCDYKLIATRELPAEKPEFDDDRMDVIGQNGNTGEHYHMMTTEEAELFAELKQFVEFAAKTKTSGSDVWKEAKTLLKRINPKPVRNSADLPVDTLCEVWSVDRGTSWLRLTHKDGFSAFSSAINDSVPENHIEFKVLEQPKPTFWLGGECPVPDWVNVKVWLSDGDIIERVAHPKSLHWKHGIDGVIDVIAYQIMGEKDV